MICLYVAILSCIHQGIPDWILVYSKLTTKKNMAHRKAQSHRSKGRSTTSGNKESGDHWQPLATKTPEFRRTFIRHWFCRFLVIRLPIIYRCPVKDIKPVVPQI